jgi:peptidoglycan/xylan/chitin deacetylase (PgdA/CDA1 family)
MKHHFNIKTTALLVARKCIYTVLFCVDQIFNRKNSLFILCYHSFAEDSWRYTVSPATFEKQMEFLSKNYGFSSIDDIYEYIKGSSMKKDKNVLISIDDGYKDVRNIIEIVKKYDIKPVLFVLSDRNNLNRKEMDNNKDILTNEEIVELYKHGWTIGCHSATHSDFHSLSKEQAYHEVIDSKKRLEKELGIPINYFSYPKGRYTKHICSLVKKADYKLAVSMDDGFISFGVNTLAVPRIGVDNTHSFLEFKAISSPLSVQFRKFVKEHVGVFI